MYIMVYYGIALTRKPKEEHTEASVGVGARVPVGGIWAAVETLAVAIVGS